MQSVHTMQLRMTSFALAKRDTPMLALVPMLTALVSDFHCSSSRSEELRKNAKNTFLKIPASSKMVDVTRMLIAHMIVQPMLSNAHARLAMYSMVLDQMLSVLMLVMSTTVAAKSTLSVHMIQRQMLLDVLAKLDTSMLALNQT